MEKIIILLTVVLMTGCQENVYRIGFIGTLRGSGSALGTQGRNGVELYISELNAKGGINGKRVELVTMDDQNNPLTAMRAVAVLQGRGASLIIGHMTSGVGILAYKRAEKLKIPLISSIMSSDVYADQNDYLFRIVGTGSYQGVLLGQYAKKEGFKNISILYDVRNKEFTETIKKSFKEIYHDKKEYITQEIPFGYKDPVDYIELVQSIVKNKSDAVILLADSTTSAKLCQTLRKMDSSAVVMMSTWSIDEELIENGGASVENAITASFFQINNKNPEYIAFKKKFARFYGEAGFSALFGYESAMLCVQVLQEYDTEKHAKLIDILDGIHMFHGLQEDIPINEYGDAERKQYLYLLKNGKFIDLKE